MSTKGLTKRAGTYREHIEGWTCDYAPPVPDLRLGTAWRQWHADIWRGTYNLGSVQARTLTAARAAARAVVLAHETRGLEPSFVEEYEERVPAGVAFYEPQEDSQWCWQVHVTHKRIGFGYAPTLREARKAAREAAE